MGHTLDDTRAAYFRASPEKMKEIYTKYIPYLTIQKELNVSESPEYIKMKSENEVLARETATATVERAELKRLTAYTEDMGRKFYKNKLENQLQMAEMQKFNKINTCELKIKLLKSNIDSLSPDEKIKVELEIAEIEAAIIFNEDYFDKIITRTKELLKK